MTSELTENVLIKKNIFHSLKSRYYWKLKYLCNNKDFYNYFLSTYAILTYPETKINIDIIKNLADLTGMRVVFPTQINETCPTKYDSVEIFNTI